MIEPFAASLWEGCFNARDAGGLRAGESVTRHRVLYRSDNLCRLTEGGLNAFAASGVETVIDVRSAYELQIDPSPLAHSDTVRYLNLPLQNEADEVAMGQINSDIALLPMYRIMLRHFGPNLAAMVDAVAQADGAVVIHCHAGKDRTGLVVALLLAAAGVEDAAIAADYAASQHYLRDALAERLATAPREERAGLEQRLGAQTETMLGVLESLRDDYGGARAYLLRAGVSPGTLGVLRNKLVDTA